MTDDQWTKIGENTLYDEKPRIKLSQGRELNL